MRIMTLVMERMTIEVVPEEEFINKLQVRPSSLQGRLILFWVKFSTLHSKSFSTDNFPVQEPEVFSIFSELTEGLLVGGRALKRFTENI